MKLDDERKKRKNTKRQFLENEHNNESSVLCSSCLSSISVRRNDDSCK